MSVKLPPPLVLCYTRRMSRQHQRTTENKHKVDKRHRTSEERRERNQAAKSRARTLVTKARRTIGAGETTTANQEIRAAISALDSAASKGIIHRNNAARRKSRLMRALAKATQPA